MQKSLLNIALITVFGFVSLNAQLPVPTDSVEIGADYDLTVWYHPENGMIKSEPLIAWDIAFQSGMNAGILINEAKGIELYHIPNSSFETYEDDIDTTDYQQNFTRWHNDPDHCYLGAFNMGKDGQSNPDYSYGWGYYSMATHYVLGDAVFIIKLADGSVKKILIEELRSGVYTFKWANPDGTDEITATMKKENYEDKNFGYFSLENNEALNDYEPDSYNWHFAFTKYGSESEDYAAYNYVGIIQNANVKSSMIDDVPEGEWPEAPEYNQDYFSGSKTAIGTKWIKYAVSEAPMINDDRVFYISADTLNHPEPNIYKLRFVRATGELLNDEGKVFFNINTGTTSVEDNASGVVPKVYPTIVERGGRLNINMNKSGKNEFTIYSMTGQMLADGLISGEAQISTAFFPAGSYIIKISNGRDLSTEKFIVK
ncbi:MAG: T9SS type A sorting domain-containing protein [Candidatus Kapaibacterium sp.]